jgi:hypothetical protein
MVMGRITLLQDFRAAQAYMKEWCRQPAARNAVYHALKIVDEVFMRGGRSTSYHVAGDLILHNPLVISQCALVYWSYGYCINGPDYLVGKGEDGFGALNDDSGWEALCESAQNFLLTFESLSGPEDIDNLITESFTVGLMKWVSLALRGCKWGVVEETRSVVELCIRRSLGWENAIEKSLESDPSSRPLQVG